LPASLLQLGGWAFVRSSQPVVGAVLFGSTNGYSLANVPQQLPAGDFIPPAQTTGAISGSIHAMDDPIPNVQLNLTGPVVATATTDGLGRYIFPQLPAGDYKVSAVRAGVQFVPPNQTVTINKQNADGVNFEASIGTSMPPIVTSVSPAATFAGNSAVNVRVMGSNFTVLSVIKLNGDPLPTSFVSSTE